MSGATAALDSLEAVSAAKSAADEAKGAALSGISDTVMEIKRELTRQKAALAPKLAEMRALREQADALDPEHRALKATADALAKQFETRCAEAVREVTRLREEVGAQESRLFELGVQSALTDEARACCAVLPFAACAGGRLPRHAGG